MQSCWDEDCYRKYLFVHFPNSGPETEEFCICLEHVETMYNQRESETVELLWAILMVHSVSSLSKQPVSPDLLDFFAQNLYTVTDGVTGS